MTAANRTRTLLNLARQVRSGENGERSGRGDLLIRQALLNVGGAGGNIEFFDDPGALGDEGDIFGIINESGANSLLQVDMPDPLSRLVANIQARVRSSAINSIGNEGLVGTGEAKSSGSGDGGNSGSATAQKTPQTLMEDCKKLHQNMREAERECYELQRTIFAWNRLDRGELVVPPGDPHSDSYSSFMPTHCSCCAHSVALQLLGLIMGIIGTDKESFEFPVTNKFIRALFDEPKGIDPELQKLKRLAIVSLVVKSKKGASLVLEVLTLRLRATRDIACAEILGLILEKEFDLADKYVTLAMDVLSQAD